MKKCPSCGHINPLGEKKCPKCGSYYSRIIEQEPQKKKEQTAKMEVFVTSWCPYCKKLEAFLDSKGIGYTRYDIEKDAEANRRYRDLGGRGVPVTVVGGNVVHGYNPDAILRLVK